MYSNYNYSNKNMIPSGNSNITPNGLINHQAMPEMFYYQNPNVQGGNDERFVGALAPFLLGGITGGLIAPAFYGGGYGRPTYNTYYGPGYGPGYMPAGPYCPYC